MICRPTSPMLVPSPVISAVNCPCRVTDNSYSRTGTVENRLTARKPFTMFSAVCWILPRPVE